MSATIEIQYFPSLLMMGLLTQPTLIEAHETYQKRSYRNKCILVSSKGPIQLSVPLEKGKNNQTSIQDVQVAYHEDWGRQHLKTIQNCYENSPYFDYYFPVIVDLINERVSTLWQLDKNILTWTCKEMGIDIPHDTADYIFTLNCDYRDRFKPNREPIEYKFCYYPQVFEAEVGFVPNVSSLDLLMNMGPESKAFLPKISGECDQ